MQLSSVMQETNCDAGDQIPEADNNAVHASEQPHDHPCLVPGGKRRLISRGRFRSARKFPNRTADQQKSDEDPDKILDQPEVRFHVLLITDFTSRCHSPGAGCPRSRGVRDLGCVPPRYTGCRVPQVSRFSRPGKPLPSNQPRSDWVPQVSRFSRPGKPLPSNQPRSDWVPQVSRFSRPGKPLLSNQPPLKPVLGLSGVVPLRGAPGSRPFFGR